jgi:putative flippase GtrA
MMFRSVYLKAQIAAILGSLADYLTVIILVEIFKCWYLLANLCGNLTGGAFQFFLGRKWAFQSQGNVYTQMLRFILIFSGNLILSAAGIYILTSLIHVNYLISKTVVSILLGLTYNYYSQKRFVFPSGPAQKDSENEPD